jgi:hypothetical protein
MAPGSVRSGWLSTLFVGSLTTVITGFVTRWRLIIDMCSVSHHHCKQTVVHVVLLRLTRSAEAITGVCSDVCWLVVWTTHM